MIVHYFIGAGLRLLLASFWFKTLTNRPEINTPMNSWKRLEECIALDAESIPPYSSDSCHALPIFIWMFKNICQVQWKLLVPVLFTICDLLAAYFLSAASRKLFRWEVERQERDKHKYAKTASHLLICDKDDTYPATPIAICYLYNPFSMMACASQTSTVFVNLCITLSLNYLASGKKFVALFSLAVAAYLEFYPCVLLVAISLYRSNHAKPAYKLILKIFLDLLCLLVFIGMLILISHYIVGTWNFINSTYGFIFGVPDLSPNVGLFWYFFTETFDHFRTFFLWIFVLNPFVYIIPLSLKLRDSPHLLFYLLLMLITVFKSYPSVGDASIYLSFLPFWRHLFPFLRHGLIVSCSLLACTILAPVMWHMWIESGSANANFYFAITLVYSTAQIFLLTDVLYAHLKRDLYLKHGPKPQINGKEAKIVLR